MTIPGFPNVPYVLTNEQQHRKALADTVNRINQGKFNATVDLTLAGSNATTTTLTDARIGGTSAVIPAMGTTAHGAACLAAGIWVTGILKGTCTVNHAANPNSDATIRFIIIG